MSEYNPLYRRWLVHRWMWKNTEFVYYGQRVMITDVFIDSVDPAH